MALASLKRTMAHLCSRISWLKDGDPNTRLFHMQAGHQKRKNDIGKLIAEEQICTSHEDKAAVIDDFYANMLGTCTVREHTINLADLGINAQDMSELEVRFTKDEVWRMIQQLPSDKAPWTGT